jgi:hypothetical protein
MHHGVKNRKRQATGSVLILSLLCTMVILLGGVLLFSHYQSLLLDHQKAQYATQAAAMAAARELSNIVYGDPRWGFVSLSDHPACGDATIAPDGEALPIDGINTIVATVRTEKLLAQNLGNATLAELADDDYQQYKELAKRLQAVWNEAVLPNSRLEIKDMNDHPVKVNQAAYNALVSNMPDIRSGRVRIKQFTLSLGTLADGSTTVTPNCERSPQYPVGNDVTDPGANRYMSFTNQPVGADSFYFAGVSDQVRLVDPSRFIPADKDHLCTCVLVQLNIEILSKPVSGSEKPDVIANLSVNAAALPYCEQNCCAPGTLVLSLPQGYADRVKCFSDLIQMQEMDRTPVSHSIAIGDFPVDGGSSLVQQQGSPTISHSVGRALFDWLRTTNARARLESIEAALNNPFENAPSETSLIITYSVDAAGGVQTNVIRDAGFINRTIADKQSQDAAHSVMTTSKGTLNVDIRDQVSDCGVQTIAKHGGQPIGSELPFAYSQFEVEQERLHLPSTDKAKLRQSYRNGGLSVAIEVYFT